MINHPFEETSATVEAPDFPKEWIGRRIFDGQILGIVYTTKTMVTRGMVYEFVLPTLFLQTLSYIVRNTGI